jgi:Ca2+-binding RTX toxin-like protein
VIPRVVTSLDYSPTGDASGYWSHTDDPSKPMWITAGTGTNIGAGDYLYGEAGDDVIHGMSGDDAIFGNAGNDHLIGGAGHDWISGGAGDDGILGDDGRIYTTRNGLTEPLYGLTSPNLQQTLTTPGNLQSAVVYVTGELNHAVVFPRPTIDGQTVDTFRVGGNDIIYGGLGNDFIHGGEGEDAISGAEALPFYHQPNPWIPLALVFAPHDSQYGVLQWQGHRERFLYYDEYDPLRKVMVRVYFDGATPATILVKHPSEGGTFYDFLLNFDATVDDGKDVIFGDGGNDWLVGGTNADRMYGGWGDDLLNADDNHDSTAGTTTRGRTTSPTPPRNRRATPTSRTAAPAATS